MTMAPVHILHTSFYTSAVLWPCMYRLYLQWRTNRKSYKSLIKLCSSGAISHWRPSPIFDSSVQHLGGLPLFVMPGSLRPCTVARCCWGYLVENFAVT